MQRDLNSLADREFDVVVVGGGIFGLCTAYDAALRGFSVAVLERGDLAAATSAACFKMVHGGMRYLQHADLVRLRHSAAERSVLLRIAPHLVEPLSIVVPTYGRGAKGRTLLAAGLGAYDLLTLDRNRGIADPARRIRRTWFMTRAEIERAFPGVRGEGLTGAAVFQDAQMYSASRLGLAFAQSAAAAGAQVANYVEATGFERDGARIAAVRARGRLDGEPAFTVRGRVVINAAGPWAEQILDSALGVRLDRPSTFSRDTFLLTTRPAPGPYALAAMGRTRDPDAVLSRAARHLFVVPWHGRLIIGVWHGVHRGLPGRFEVSEDEIAAYLDEINWSYPGLGLERGEIGMWSAGLVLFGDNAPGAVNLSYGKRSRVIDHAAHGVPNLLTLIGVRYTTARAEAEEAVDWAARRLGAAGRRCGTSLRPLAGGDVEDVEALVGLAQREYASVVGDAAVRALVRNHGTGYRGIAEAARHDPLAAAPLGGTTTLAAEVDHAVRSEMAVRLEDVVLRRTDMGATGHPGAAAVDAAAARMGGQLGWSAARRRREIDAVEAVFRWRAGGAATPSHQAPGT